MQKGFVTALPILSIISMCVPFCNGKGGSGGGGGGHGGSTGHGFSSYSTMHGGSSSGSTTFSPAPPPCQPVTGSVSANILRDNPCVETSPCSVVVNSKANTAELCLLWSPNSFWDGSQCMCRCELLGGVLDRSATVPMNTCLLNGVGVAIYSKLTPNAGIYLAPIACGTWLGARDSAWEKSWFASDCFSILENRLEAGPASVHECGVDRYTTGCRFLDTNQQWVPECRTSTITECGVKVACPSPNPCGLASDIYTNLNNDVANCATQTHLAVNVSANATTCYDWNEYAFLLDGYCVSSCGRFDNQCVLDGVHVPPCNTVRSFEDNSISSISPEICSVPMRSDAFAGFRNGFYGMSRVKDSKCLATVNCTSRVLCFTIEGLDITPLAYELSAKIPVCIGDISKRCKIEYPCSIPVIPSECSSGVLGISEAIWVGFGVYSCPWFTARDGIIVFFWIGSFFWVFTWLSDMDTIEKYNLKELSCFGFIVVYLLATSFWIGVSCVWDFAIVLATIYQALSLVVPFVFRKLYSCFYGTGQSSAARYTSLRNTDVAAVSIER